jgi:hypothetical protein
MKAKILTFYRLQEVLVPGERPIQAEYKPLNYKLFLEADAYE